MIRIIAAGLGTIVALPVLIAAAAITTILGSGTPGLLPRSADIPEPMRTHYTDAARDLRVPAALLAAVGKVECDHHRHPRCDTPNEFGAVGPMQFLPETFRRWQGASGSDQPSILDRRDAVYAAAAKLAADGVATDPRAALLAYNNSGAYVATVAGWALRYGWPLPTTSFLAQAVLDSPRISLRPDAAADIAPCVDPDHTCAIDGRVLASLLAISTDHDLEWVGPLRTGHSRFVAGTTRISNHTVGRAVDVPMVDGRPVNSDNAAAAAAASIALDLPGELRPDDLGSPFADLKADGAFSDADHHDHLHLGWDEGGGNQ